MAITKASGAGKKHGSKTKGHGPAKKDVAEAVRIQQLVDEAIAGIEKRLNDEDSPPTIGDYLKVMQLQKDIEEEAPKEIIVTWVEPGKAAAPESER